MNDLAEPVEGSRSGDSAAAEPVSLDSILDIPVCVQIVVGSASMPVAKLMKLSRGSVIDLDQRVGDLVSVVVNGRTVARGEMVVVDEENSRFGVSLVEIVGSPAPDRDVRGK
jgi:flagellar motor switch protein FliN/FliY